MDLTEAQQAACRARGNVLVVAGAGTGKTRTLVERCLTCLLEERPRVSLDELLLVTFTEAAAAEMRQRVRARLEEQAARQPQDRHWSEQLALFETAQIGTLHAFCLQLVRRHFYQLGLDPQLAVLPEEESRLMAEETLDGLLEKYYGGRGLTAEAVQELIQVQGRGRDQPLRSLVLKLHNYSQTQPNPAGWLEEQTSAFSEAEPRLWRSWLLDALTEWRETWPSILETDEAHGAKSWAEAIRVLPARPSPTEAAVVLESILAQREGPPKKRKSSGKPIERFQAEVEFLASVCPRPPGNEECGRSEPLAEDWTWVRSQMQTLLQLTAEFTAAFSEAKREAGVVDFHDLEQHALALLWDFKANQPTALAEQWRRKLRFVFVDEYQDINAAQDRIIAALSREGEESNRFLVGDVKQSIYRFRLANPYIFQDYWRQWSKSGGQAIPLQENFRSRERLLDFINSLFSTVMLPELGGMAYDEQARLRFGAPVERAPLGAAGADPRVELHMRLKGKDASFAPENEEEWGEALDQFRELEEAAKEARLVAIRLRQLKTDGHTVWDEATRGFRLVEWRDIAVLLRSPSNKAESYAKEFSRLNIPLQVARGGFYESLEISDLLNLLRLLDNPLQDLPAVAVLRSPFVGLAVDDLARIRLALPRGHFWSALLKWAETQGASSEKASGEPTVPKVLSFLERFERWRRRARQVSLSACLEMLLAETHYADWLFTQSRGEQRRANVHRLLAVAEQFDQFQRQGLFRFLRFIEAQQAAESEPEVPAVTETDAVRLMSIHQSKGLEFPVVVVADLGKPFNLSDVTTEIILDETYGLCPRVKPPHSGSRYPSLAHWLARRRQFRESLAEELRLLYVALTRARDTLVLTGSVFGARFKKLWRQQGEGLNAVFSARSAADWLASWFGKHVGLEVVDELQGDTDLLRWRLYDEAALVVSEAQPNVLEPTETPAPAPEAWHAVQDRLSWSYPWLPATKQPAKTSVSALRRLTADAEQESAKLFRTRGDRAAVSAARFQVPAKSMDAAADVGTAHHEFLQHVELEKTGSLAQIETEAKRLQELGFLTAQQVALLDLRGLFAFWDSELGRKFRAQAPFVRRELPFTARFSPAEIAQLLNEPAPEKLDQEFVVVQGVADLVALLPREIWLLDFKSDDVRSKQLEQRLETYRPQIRIYSAGLSRIYSRPVSQSWIYFISVRKAVECR
jgi:ATP-dependent helicase/nuclease subunit A